MKTTVVIATYNEKDNILNLIHDILNLNSVELEAIIVDDNSPDGTAKIVEQNFAGRPVELVVRNGQRGYGSAHVCGFKRALEKGADTVVSMDADFSHQPSDILRLVSQIEAGYDVAVGSRRIKDGRVIGWNWKRKLASKTAMVIARLILRLKTRDVTSGFRAYRASALRRLSLDTIASNGYSFLEELIYRCERQGLKIKEVPIVFRDREKGKSKFTTKEIIKFFVTIYKLRFKTHKI